MKRLAAFFVLLAAALLSGCQGRNHTGGGEYLYQIYYLNPANTRLVAQDYYTDTTDRDLLIEELMNQFMRVPDDVDSQTALADKVVYRGHTQEDMVLFVHFDNNYTSMKPYREVLCRAALVKTLTQVPGIDYLSIYSGDQPLLDANGTPVGMMSASDFVESISDVNAFERAELTLYFTDESGELLYPESREVVYSTNTSMERVIIDELIGGPEQEGRYPTLDKNTKILSVSVNENVCYVNFDNTFLSNSLEVKDYIPIYSIVNSLSELTSVNRVQISINGSKDGVFRESIPLNTLFERNLDYIGGE